MNAYELADELQETEPYYSTDYKLFDKSVNMLRQQADRIAELSKNVDELEEELLKTPQTKPLSDEEILDLWCDMLEDAAKDIKVFVRAIEERHGIK